MMQRLPVSYWTVALQRISQRYAGQHILLRQKQLREKDAQTVLWRTPLRRISADAAGQITVVAGHKKPFIEICLGPIKQIHLQLASDSLDLLRFRSHDGTTSEMLFKLE